MPTELMYITPNVKGINYRNYILDIQEGDAVDMENYVIQAGKLVERRGYKFITELPIILKKYKIINIEYYRGTAINKNAKLIIAIKDKCDFLELSLEGTPPVASWKEIIFKPPISVDHKIERKWNTCRFQRYIYFVNGVNKGLVYNGEYLDEIRFQSKLDDAIKDIDSTSINCICQHKNIIFFSLVDTLTVYYSIDSSYVYYGFFSISDYSKLGGAICAMTSWTRSTPEGTMHQLVIITNRGEVFLFDGQSPYTGTTDKPVISDWKLAGVYTIAEPLGYWQNKFVKTCEVGAGLVILTRRGFINISDLVYGLDVKAQFNNKINPFFTEENEHALLDNIDNFDMYYARSQNYFIINIPVLPEVSQTGTIQFLYDLQNSAWIKFTGIPAILWQDFRGEMYFVDNGGHFYQMFSGDTDDNSNINYSVTTNTITKQHLRDKINNVVMQFSRPKQERLAKTPQLNLKIEVLTNSEKIYDKIEDVPEHIYKFSIPHVAPQQCSVNSIEGNIFNIRFQYQSICNDIEYQGMFIL